MPDQTAQIDIMKWELVTKTRHRQVEVVSCECHQPVPVLVLFSVILDIKPKYVGKCWYLVGG